MRVPFHLRSILMISGSFLLIASILFICGCCDKNPAKNDEPENVTDIDGNVYQIVKIGDQWWMAENLKVTRYRNGDAIPNVTQDSEWRGLVTGAQCVYDNDENHETVYGRFYNWCAVNDSRKIAPKGWHVPTDAEWMQLEMCLGMSLSEVDENDWRGTDEGGKLKESGTSHWIEPNTGATDESGFTALPAGYRSYFGAFSDLGYNAFFWSNTELDSDTERAWARLLGYSHSSIGRGNFSKLHGFSIRCVRD